MTPITLKELKELVKPTHGQKLPTAKALRESDAEVVAEAAIGMDGKLRVYQSGFYSYETPSGTTVYAVDRLDGYRYENGDALNDDMLEGMDWTVSLMLAGEDRLEHNQQQREEGVHFSYSHDVVEGIDMRDPFDFAAAFENRDMVEKMMEVLTQKQREVVRLYFVQGLKQEEIQRLLGLSRGAFLDRLNGAIKKLKILFE